MFQLSRIETLSDDELRKSMEQTVIFFQKFVEAFYVLASILDFNRNDQSSENTCNSSSKKAVALHNSEMDLIVVFKENE